MKKKASMNRRSFVKLLPAIGAAGLTKPSLGLEAAAPLQQAPQQQQVQRVTREMMHAAEQLIGLEMTEAQEAMALSGVTALLWL